MHQDRFETPQDSLDYLERRFAEYPLFREFSGLWGEHDGEVVLDYGCGPGNAVVGFLVHTGAERVIGVDVSPSALELALERIELHDIEASRYELIRTTDRACREAGFEAEFLGGYLSRHELEQLDEHGEAAIADERLGEEHRAFLRELESDARGYPTWRGKHAGIGGSYLLHGLPRSS